MFVDKVDGFIRQEAIRDVARSKSTAGLERVI